MRLFPVLLRLLLCVAILANGVASAQAGVRMALAHPAAQAHAEPAAASPCHHHGHVAETAPAPRHATGDCCDGHRCDCPCMGTLMQAVAMPAVPQAIAHQPAPDAPAAIDLPTPRLAHLIRPPIG